MLRCSFHLNSVVGLPDFVFLCLTPVFCRLPARSLTGGKLRDVPPYEHCQQLAAEAATLGLPRSLQTAVTSMLPPGQQQQQLGLATVACCQTDAAGNACAVRLDPWLLLDGGPDSGGGFSATALAARAALPPTEASALAVPWLAGAVKRRRRDLCFVPPPASAACADGPLLSVQQTSEQQLEDALL